MTTSLKRLVKKAQALVTPAPEDMRPMFDQMLKEVAASLGDLGVRKRGRDLVWESDECWGVIHFQKDRKDHLEEQKFTVDLGVASKRILRFDGLVTDRAPRTHECCWRRRLGQLGKKPTDLCWSMTDYWTFRTAVDDVTDLIRSEALPAMKTLMEDRALLRLHGHHWGAFLSDFAALRFKAIILAELGPSQELSLVLQRMRKVSRFGITQGECESTIRRLRELFPAMFP
jgi:hypothetical protein